MPQSNESQEPQLESLCPRERPDMWQPRPNAAKQTSEESRKTGLSFLKTIVRLVIHLFNILSSNCVSGRDITLPTKVRTVKAMVFPVVMYECERWIIKKAEC